MGMGEEDDQERGRNIQRKQLSLHLQRAHFLTPRLNDIDALPAADEIHRPSCPGPTASTTGTIDDMPRRYIASLKPLRSPIIAGDKRLARRFLVGPVSAEQRRATQLDLSLTLAAIRSKFLARLDDLLCLGVDETDLHAWERPAHAAVDAVGPVQSAAERHAHFSHAESLEEDVAVA
jgi:hypothetical protein